MDHTLRLTNDELQVLRKALYAYESEYQIRLPPHQQRIFESLRTRLASIK